MLTIKSWSIPYCSTDAPLSLASTASTSATNPGMKPTCLALRHQASPRTVLSMPLKRGPAVASNVPFGRHRAAFCPRCGRMPRLVPAASVQPQLIGSIEVALSVQASGHQFGNVAVLGDRHADHRPLGPIVELCSLRWRAPVFCLTCRPTKIKDTTTPTEAMICARLDSCSSDMGFIRHVWI